jgi:repressor LexA
MNTLSSRQRQILEKIAEHLDGGTIPSSAQLAKELGLAGESSLTPTLRLLESKDYLQLSGGLRGRQRGLALTPKAKAELQRKGLPLLGLIPAGGVQEAITEGASWIERLEDLLPYQTGDFLLQVKGDSMIGDGILPGDLVLIRPNLRPESGQIVAVAVGEDHLVTLKHIYILEDQIRLVPSNPDHPEQLYPSNEVRILGTYQALIRGAHSAIRST